MDGWIDADVLLAYLEDENEHRVQQVWGRAPSWTGPPRMNGSDGGIGPWHMSAV